MKIFRRYEGGDYCVDTTVNGRRIRKSPSTDKRVAEKLAVSLEYGALSDTPVYTIKLNEAFIKFEHHVHNSGVTVAQQRLVISYVKGFVDWCDKDILESITPEMAHNYISVRSDNTGNAKYGGGSVNYVKPSTVNKTIQALKRFFTFCIDMELTGKNPFSSVKCLPTKKVQRYFLNSDEEKMVINSDQYGDLYEFLLETGLRCTDVFSLTSDCISSNKLTIRMKKTGDFLCIPLTPRALEIIKGREGLLFPEVKSQRKQKYARKHLQSLFNAEYVRIKNITFHTLRHTYAHKCLDKGMPKEHLQTFLGHRSVKTTEIYANWVKVDVLEQWVTS